MIDTQLYDTVVKEIGVFLETDISHLKPESRLASEVEGLSSLKLYELMLYLEDAVGFDFDEKVVDKIDTLQELVAYIQERKH
ncbi:MAG TPA: acyl carrier protein [Stellaceae bacterium]|nr:acyl carrier protein [Stellaceae bacterium]